MTVSKKTFMTALLALTAQQAYGAFESMQCGLANPSTGETIGGFDEYNIAEYAGDLADNGQCTVGPGVGVCTRVSCGNTSGIWLCNRGDTEVSVDCGVVARYVNDSDVGLPDYRNPNTLMQCQCSQYTCSEKQGQINDTDGFYVVAAYANCDNDSSLGPYDQ